QDTKGRIVKWYGSNTDIHDMKEAEEILRRSRQQLQAIIDAVPSLISYVDRNLRYRLHNRTYHEWFQLSADVIADRHMRDVLGEDAFQRILPRVLKGMSGEMVEFDDYLPYRAGGGRWVHGVYMPHRDRSGDVDGIVIFVSDITARKRNEDQLRKAVERFELLSKTARRLLESESPQGAIRGLCMEVMSYLGCDVFFNFLVDKSKGRLRLNACAGIPEETYRQIAWLEYGEAVCGCVAKDGNGIVCENIPDTSDHRTDFVKSLGIQSYACYPIIYRGTVEGTVSFGSRSRCAFTEEEQALMKSIADMVSIAIERVRTRETLQELVQERTAELEAEIVDRMHAQVALRQSEERYRNLAAHLQSMREDERARIAREVHDELGQVLAGMNFDVSTLAAKYHDHKPVIERTESISRQIVAALQTVKRICTELRPSILDHFGISEAIKWQAEEFQKRSGIACTISVKPDVIVLDGDLSTVVFRIFQEALTNIARHAEASEIIVVFKKERGTVVLKVTDNGKGIEEEHISGSGLTFGLMGIKERAEHAGGHVVIKRNRGGERRYYCGFPSRTDLRGTLSPFRTSTEQAAISPFGSERVLRRGSPAEPRSLLFSLSSQEFFYDFRRVFDIFRASCAEDLALPRDLHAFRSSDVTAEQFLADYRTVECPESLRKGPHKAIGLLLCPEVFWDCASVFQPNDHDRACHRTACLPHATHAATEGSRNLQGGLTVQTEFRAIRREKSLGAIEPVPERRED
ncbi:MAG TPA: PAS domain-containing protein, partial [Dissulfurispiraceae bacterium]|nr:PAS domain-containing protein [Dissulfurispiraceae bacterium]